MKNSIFKKLSIILAIGVIAVGCDLTESTVDGPSDVQVQMKVNTTPAAKAMLTSNNEHANTLEIQEVKLFIEEMELESVAEDSSDFEDENFIVSLPLDGSPVNLSQQAIEPGLYDEFELEVERPDDDEDSVSDPDFRDGDRTYSVVVKGLYQGEEFIYRSTEDFEIEMDLNPALEVLESESTALVINIDIDSWFKDSNGNDLDPNDSRNFERIDENIENSFEGFEDDNDDDVDDDDEDDDDDD